MNLHDVFARNLRLKCSEYGTIAGFCRASGLNRQQFNKYLAGSSLPNAVTLRKICKVLGVKEEMLFDAKWFGAENKQRSADLIGSNLLQQLGFGNAAQKLNFSPTFLQPGYYYCYFDVPGMKHTLLRSLLYIKSTGNLLQFTRLTYVRSPVGSGKMMAIGRHKGFMCANDLELYFIGINHSPPHQITMMVFEKPVDVREWLIGLTFTRVLNSMSSVRTIAVPVPKSVKINEALRSLGHVELTETDFEIQLFRNA